jgi:hypothetical protein
MCCNFGRIPVTMRVTPAMEAGISDHMWSVEIVELSGDGSALSTWRA